MIVLAIIALSYGHGRGQPPAVHVSGIPNLFGACVYSFMCHHSLPGLITPISKKRNIHWLIFADYLLILVFYLLLSFTGALAFDRLQDIYTLNFQRDKCATESDTLIVPTVSFFQYFLPLFPVFTLAASFPIISITLTNNIRSLMKPHLDKRQRSSSSASLREEPQGIFFICDRIMFPVCAIVPPIVLTLFTENLQVLVGITGSYAGASIQYVIPALLVYYARKTNVESEVDKIKRSFESPFASSFWVWFVMAWSAICVVLVTIDHIFE